MTNFDNYSSDAIVELNDAELTNVVGGGLLSDLGDAIEAVGDAIYDAGYRLGAAVASLFED